MAPSSVPLLLEREAELGQLAGAWEACRGGSGRLVYVEGQPGIGKTELVGAAVRAAAGSGVRVLTARGGALEQDYSYGIARQLFEADVLRDPSLLRGPAALAGTTLGTDAPSASEPDSAFPVIHGLYWLTANLALAGPLVLVIDDAHWADGPSLRFVDYLAARLDGLAVSIVLASRPVGRDADGTLLAVRDRGGAVLVRPAPLGPDAVGELVGVGTGAAGAGPEAPFVAACHEASGGNPFLLGEMLAALALEGVAPLASAAPRVRALAPEAVERSLRLRLASLAPAASDVAEAVSVLGSDAELRHVATLADHPYDVVGDAVDVLTGVGILGPGPGVGFAHPVVRQAIYARLPRAARSRRHRQAAAELLGEGQPAIRVAPHLLACEPAGDAEVVRTLVAAAETALGQGAAEPAQRYLERALAEPPTVEDQGKVLALLGHALAQTGRDLDRACGHLERAAELSGTSAEGAERLELAARYRLYHGDPQGAIELLDRPFAQGDVDRETGLRLRAHQAGVGVLVPLLGRAAIDRLEQYAELPGDTPAELAVLAELAASRWLDGRIGEAAVLAERALAGGRLLEAEGPVSVAFNHSVHILLDADRYDLALPVLESGIALARTHGSVLGMGSLICLRAVSGWRRGVIDEVETGALDALALLESGGTEVAGPALRGYLALALLERGDLDAAARESERSGISPGLLELSYFGTPFDARARLELAQGRPDAALATLLELASRDERLGIRHMSTLWRRTAVETCLALGDHDRARAFAAEQLALTERWDTASARGLALATAGLADGTDAGLELLEAGIAALADSPARLDHARALLDLGATLRRGGRRADARPPLREALDLATGCGATALAARAREEIVAAGARPRRHRISGPEALTASERRVARMAADGHANREIAQALYITVRTVENHLGRVYGKLDITSRRDLAGALGEQKMSGLHS